MPKFDYKCPDCGHVKNNKLVQRHDQEVKCDKCDAVMKKQICAPNIGGMDELGRSGSTKLPD